MTNLPPLKVQMRCLIHTLHAFFQTLAENQREIDYILGKMRDLRQEHFEYLCKEGLPQIIQEKGEKPLSTKEVTLVFQKLFASSQQHQNKAYQWIEQEIWGKLLGSICQQALDKKIPELFAVTQKLDVIIEERNTLLAQKEKLQNSLNDLTQQINKLRQDKDSLESKVASLTTSNTKLKEYEIANKDYQEIICKIRKELEAKKDLDMWRLKVLYNRVAALTRSELIYPGVPKPDYFVPESKEVQKFLESL